MCRWTRLRSRIVRRPSQPASRVASSSHSPRPARPTSSTARHVSSCSRARDSSACAWLRETPSTVATSAVSRPWRSWSSMTSRSPGFSPAVASSSSARRSARSASAATSPESSVTSGASSERRRPLLRPEDPQRLIPRHGVQPGTQPTRVTQSVEPGCGDDEGVLNGVRGVGRVAEQGSAVLEEGICVPVVGSGKPEGIACHDGRDNLAVAHASTLAVLAFVRGGRGVIVGIPTSAT